MEENNYFDEVCSLFQMKLEYRSMKRLLDVGIHKYPHRFTDIVDIDTILYNDKDAIVNKLCKPIAKDKGQQWEIIVQKPEDIARMKIAGRIAREVLDEAVKFVKPGVTTDDIDRIVHEETVKRNAYPSPLNYNGFPKSCCTSINEVICHGIPDSTIVNEGDIINSKYNNRKIKSFINESNYKCIYLYYEDNKKSSFLLHRLLGKYFLENGNNYFNDSKYVINHKDKNKLNNNIINLEWITQKENTIHGRGRKICKIDIKTDEIIKIYTNITDAYIELNKPWNSLISKVCNGNYGRKTIYGFKWKYKKDLVI
jgi:hypothetical protein